MGIIGLTVISYIHAYRFTHFSDTSSPRTDPKTLSVYDKIGIIFTGIQNPRQQDTLLPSVPYQTYIMKGEKELESWYMSHPESKGLILLYHGYAGNKSQMLSRAMDLKDLGFATAIVGFRGSGNSEGKYTTIGYQESQDVINSFNFYQEKFPDQSLFLYGSSMGAAAIIKALSEEELPVEGIILEYPFGSLYQSVQNRFKVMGFPSFPMAAFLTFFGGYQLDFDGFEHNPAEYAKAVECPTLYLAGDNDDRVTNEETMEVYNNLQSVHKSLYIFKGGGHESFNEKFPEAWKLVCEKFLYEVK